MRLDVKIFTVLLFLFCAPVSFAQSPCYGRPATENEQPHGANEIIEMSAKPVNRLFGKVTDVNGGAISSAVIEVYDCTNSECEKEIYSRTRKRLDARVADDEGQFCFQNLSSGRYLLVFGTHGSEGLKEMYVKVKLDRNWWSRWYRSGKALNIHLFVGT